jgi:hypothetical protein
MSACLQALAFWGDKLAAGPMYSDIIHWKYVPGTANETAGSRNDPPEANKK